MGDYSLIISPIRKLIISGNSDNFIKGVPLKHVQTYIDLEKRSDKEHRGRNELQGIINKLKDNLNVSSEDGKDKSVVNKDNLEEAKINSQELKVNSEESNVNSEETEVYEFVNSEVNSKTKVFEFSILLQLLQNVAEKAVFDWKLVTTPILTLIEEGKGLQVLDSLKVASKHPNVSREMLVLCLIILTKQTSDKKLVANAYSAVTQICNTSSLFFLFLQLNKIFSKANKTKGWGRGLKRSVRNWYLQWEPRLLALELSRQPRGFTWSHVDIIRLAHLKLKDFPVGTQVVLHYVFSGLSKTIATYKDNENAAVLIDIIQILHIEKDNQNINKLIERGKNILKEFNSLSIADFPSQVINDDNMLKFILSNGSLMTVIDALIKTNLFKICVMNQEMRELLFSVIQKEPFDQNTNAFDILIAYNICRRKAVIVNNENEELKPKWMKNAKPLAEKSAKVTVPKIPNENSKEIIEELGKLLVKATETYTKTERKAVIFIDTSPSMKNFIHVSSDYSSTKEIRGIQAISFILLSLASNNRFDTVFPVFFSATGFEKPSMPKPCPFHFIQTKLKTIAISTVKVKEAVDYAILHKLDSCIILCHTITGDFAKAAYQSIVDIQAKDNKIRLIICGIMIPDDNLPQPASFSHPDLLLLHGFNRNTLQTIRAFHEGMF